MFSIEKVLKTLREIESIFKETAESLGGKITFDSKKLADGYFFESDHPLVALASSLISAQGVEPKYFDSIGGSDANILNGKGIETVVISSAHRDNHKTTEYLIIPDLIKLTELIVHLATVF